jgi:hypothetical protein
MLVLGALTPATAAPASQAGTLAPAMGYPAGEQFERIHQELNLRLAEILAAPVSPAQAAQPAPVPEPNFRGHQKEGSAALSRAAIRVRRLLPTIVPILRQEGVPAEFGAMVLVESGGLPAALSPKGARGLWQLMPATARRYGLVVSPEQDDRLDLEKSTRAAARYLRDLRAQFGNWELVLAAYNTGEQALGRALARASGSGFASASIYLPAETQAYVPAVSSAMQLLKTGSSEPSGTALVVFAEARF